MRVGFGRRGYSVFRFVVGVGTEAVVVRKEWGKNRGPFLYLQGITEVG